MTTLYMESVALAAEVHSLQQRVMRRDQELGRRLRRAAEDVPEHLAESMCLTGRNRRHELEAAGRGLRELWACVRAAAGAGHLPERDAALEAQIERLLARVETREQGSGEPITRKSA